MTFEAFKISYFVDIISTGYTEKVAYAIIINSTTYALSHFMMHMKTT